MIFLGLSFHEGTRTQGSPGLKMSPPLSVGLIPFDLYWDLGIRLSYLFLLEFPVPSSPFSSPDPVV